jgi:hypothetical protein
MQELYLNAHKESQILMTDEGSEPSTRKTISMQLQYVFDWKAFFKPVVNKTIKYFNKIKIS